MALCHKEHRTSTRVFAIHFPVLALLFLLESAAGQYEQSAAQTKESPNSSVAVQYQAILKSYEKKLVELHRQKAGQQQIVDLGKTRNASFAKLVEDNGQQDLKDLKIPDLVALATCCEYTRSYYQSLKYSRQAIERDPDDRTGYAPLVRALINLGATDEARDVMLAASRRFAANDVFHSLNGILFAKYKSLGKLDAAATHISRLLEFYFATLEESPLYVRYATKYLGQFAETMEKAGKTDQLSDKLRQYRKLVSHKLIEINKRLSESKTETSELDPKSALMNLDCELIRILNPAAAVDAQANWIAFVSRIVASQPGNLTMRNELIRSLNYASQHSYLWKETDKLEQGLQKAADEFATVRARPLKSVSPSVILKMVNGLREQIQQVQQLNDLIGSRAPSLDQLDCINKESQQDSSSNSKLVLLYFWHPKKRPGASGLKTLRLVRSHFSSTELRIIGVAPFTGFQLAMKENTKSPNRTHDAIAEQQSMATFLVRHRIKLPVALIGKQSGFSRFSEMADYPRYMLIDSERKIRLTGLAINPSQLQYLENQMRSLLQNSR